MRTPSSTPSMSSVPHPGLARLSATSQRVLMEAKMRWANDLGTGSQGVLLQQALRVLAPISGFDARRGACAQEELCLIQLEKAHRIRYGHVALRAELTDERDRDQAAADGAALVKYQEKWERKLSKLQRAHPGRWRVPGLSDDEVRDALTLCLIEAICGEPEVWQRDCRAGKEWGLVVAERRMAALRKSFRLAATPTDFDAISIAHREPSQEDRWLQIEGDRSRALAQQSARAGLSQPQRRWLAALETAAREGEFFASSDKLNLTAASRLLGKNRSSAQRAYKELQARFMGERERFE